MQAQYILLEELGAKEHRMFHPNDHPARQQFGSRGMLTDNSRPLG